MQPKMGRFKLGSINRANFEDKFKFLQKRLNIALNTATQRITSLAQFSLFSY